MPDIGNINNMLNQTNIQKDNKQTSEMKRKLNEAYKSQDKERLMDACKEFETMFMHMLLKEMRSTVPDGGLIEKSSGREIFEDMYDQEIAESSTKEGQGIGLAKILYEQMKNRI